MPSDWIDDAKLSALTARLRNVGSETADQAAEAIGALWRHIESLAGPTAVLTASCVWTVDEDGNYHTACDGMFIVLDGTPRENGMNFCCYCGRTLTEADGRAPDAQTEGEGDGPV